MRPRITDVDNKPARIFSEDDITTHVAAFLAKGGVITQCVDRRDFLEPLAGKESRTRRKWKTLPPDLRESAQRGGKRK